MKNVLSPYRHKSNVLFLDSSGEKQYLIHDAPVSIEAVREKLEEHGPLLLSTKELLAVALDTGMADEDVMALSGRIMREYGEKSIMSATDPKKLSMDLDIPLARASQIVACAELGRRFHKKNEASAPTIRTANDVFEYVKDMRDLSKEHLRGIYLNAHYKIIHDEVISIGTVDTNIIHPREVFRPALEYAAAAVILVHNHPSGQTAPSDADITVTEQLVKAGKLIGIDLVDHIIVTKNGFESVSVEYSK